MADEIPIQPDVQLHGVTTIVLPDGYNGHTVECDVMPIARQGDEYKLRVSGSYLIRWVSRQQWEAAIQAAGLTVPVVPPDESASVRWHQGDLNLNQSPDQRAALLTALEAVVWQPLPLTKQQPVDVDCPSSLLADEYDQFKARAVLRRFRANRVPVFALGVSVDYIAIEAGDNAAAGRYQSLWTKHDDHMVCLVSREVVEVK